MTTITVINLNFTRVGEGETQVVLDVKAAEATAITSYDLSLIGPEPIGQLLNTILLLAQLPQAKEVPAGVLH